MKWYENFQTFLNEYGTNQKCMDRDFIVMVSESTQQVNVVAQGIGNCIGSFFVDEQFCDLNEICSAFLKYQHFPTTRSLIITEF